MPQVFVGNFDFEHELAEGHASRSSNVREIAAELAAAWVVMADAGDVIWSPGGIPDFDFSEFSKLSGFQPRFIRCCWWRWASRWWGAAERTSMVAVP